MLKDFKPRLYQETILDTTSKFNTLVVLPTGMGKTMIALMLAVNRITNHPNSKILIIAPTKPLAEQHLQTFKKLINLEEDKFALFTGAVKPEIRHELWKTTQFIFSTPQGLENDIISNKISLKDVSLLVVDEAHRAVKEYSYVWIAKQYNRKADFPRILGLTASPGSDIETISEVCKNLYIEEVEVRTEHDPDVKPYIQEVKLNWVKVNLPPELKTIKKYLDDCYKSKLRETKKYGYLNSIQYTSKRELLSLQGKLHHQLSQGDKDFALLKSISLIAEAMKVEHAIALLETQGITALSCYLDKLQEQAVTTKVKAVKNLVRDLNFKSAWIKTNKLKENNIEHPKLEELKNIIKKEIKKDIKIIIFNQFRDNAAKIVEELNKIKEVSAELFVGQTKKGGTGLTQKKQIELLNKFRNGEFNTICMTSVGEEGLDIPKVDLVIFYEPIPSAIRTIQRRGRTGRTEKGKIIILTTNNTRDEAYKWSAHYKEKRMYRTLSTIKTKIKDFLKEKHQQELTKYAPEGNLKIIADFREKGSGIIKELIELGANTSLETLNTADYVISNRVGIEHKTTEDFVNSIIDGRLLEQVKELKNKYERPLIIVEGNQDIYSIRKIHPNAIRGMLATIAISYGIPIIHTKDFKESASLINIIAKREQEKQGSYFSPHGEKRIATLKDQQEYFISALPNIGLSLAKNLLTEFKTVKNVINSSEDRLKKVEKMGDKKVRAVKDVFEKEYS